ncbi:MAG TPA: Trm112 family protein [Patescibacteria group bacterium]|nr:Trm112 family protein [Patescibacteria group bacterium]
MKPWLLNILACPIDKHHPLEAYFFRWETPEEKIKEIAADASLPSPDIKLRYEQLAKQLKDGTVSPAAMKSIVDKSGSTSASGLLAVTMDTLHRIEMITDKCEEDLLKDNDQDLDALDRFFNRIELDAGLLVCPECGRWYPIGSAVETIPEMLPDDLREEERDLDWLEKWRELIPPQVLESGRPFNLSGKE